MGPTAVPVDPNREDLIAIGVNCCHYMPGGDTGHVMLGTSPPKENHQSASFGHHEMLEAAHLTIAAPQVVTTGWHHDADLD